MFFSGLSRPAIAVLLAGEALIGRGRQQQFAGRTEELDFVLFNKPDDMMALALEFAATEETISN